MSNFRNLIREIIDKIYHICRDDHNRSNAFVSLLFDKWPLNRDQKLREWIKGASQDDINSFSWPDPRGWTFDTWENTVDDNRVFRFNIDEGPKLNRELDNNLILFSHELDILCKYSNEMMS